jgi:magnesium transporter
MNTIFVHRDGRTAQVTSIDRSWLSPSSGVYTWVDLASPSIPESLVLSDTFAFNRLAVEEAKASTHSPRIDVYGEYLFAAVAGPDADAGFFVGAHHLVSVHWAESKAVADLIDSVRHGGKQFAEGPFAMFHRLVDAMSAGFKPVVDTLAADAESVEKRLLDKATADVLRDVLRLRRETFSLKQRLARQEDSAAQLAKGGAIAMSSEMRDRFRAVDNQLVRLLDDTLAIEHRLGDALIALGAATKKSWM